jgi:DHA2 family multidrug resistance protein
MMTKPLLGLLGILIAASTAELNDVVTSIALVDVRGAFGISYDPGTWIQSLYVSAEIVGMAVSPWQLVTFTLRRWTLFSIALCALSSALIPFSPNIEAIYVLRPLQGFSEGLIIPLLMTTALRALTPQSRLYGLAVYALSSTFTPALAGGLAVRVLPGRSALHAGGRPRLVRRPAGQDALRAIPRAGLARHRSSRGRIRCLQHHAISG